MCVTQVENADLTGTFASLVSAVRFPRFPQSNFISGRPVLKNKYCEMSMVKLYCV